MKKYPTIITGALLPIYAFLLAILYDFLSYKTSIRVTLLILFCISGVAVALCLIKNNLLNFCKSLIHLILSIIISYITFFGTGLYFLFQLFPSISPDVGLVFFITTFGCLIFCLVGALVAGGISLYRQLTTKKHEQ